MSSEIEQLFLLSGSLKSDFIINPLFKYTLNSLFKYKRNDICKYFELYQITINVCRTEHTPAQYLTSATTNCPISRRFASRFNKVRFVGVCVDTYGMPRSLVSVGVSCSGVRVTSAARFHCQIKLIYLSSHTHGYFQRKRGKKMVTCSSNNTGQVSCKCVRCCHVNAYCALLCIRV